MEPQLHLIYFSPTGGTKNAAELLGESVAREMIEHDVTTVAGQQKKILLHSEDCAIFAAPSYGGRLPAVRRLFENVEGQGTLAILMCAYGNRAFEHILAEMQARVERAGFHVIGAIAVVTPHVFSEKAGHGRPDASDRLKIRSFGEKMRNRWLDGQCVNISVPGEAITEPKVIGAAKKQFLAENCTLCMRCVNECPVSAINRETMQVEEENCIHCQRCTFVCNFHARTYDARRLYSYIENNLFRRQPVVEFIE